LKKKDKTWVMDNNIMCCMLWQWWTWNTHMQCKQKCVMIP